MSIIGDYLIERMNRIKQKVAEEAAWRKKTEAARKANEERIKNAEGNLKIVMARRAAQPTPTKRGMGLAKFLQGSKRGKERRGVKDEGWRE